MRHDSSPRPLLFIVAAIGALALTAVSESLAQGRGSAQTWWVAKTKGGVYNPPMRPIWRKADLVRTHAGQNIWSEQIIRDPEHDATYNSAAPGTKCGWTDLTRNRNPCPCICGLGCAL